MSDGKKFEAEVRLLLELKGWHLSQEQIVNHKKVDLLGVKRVDFGVEERIAVECKDYESALTQEQVTNIYSNYLPLLQTQSVDRLVLITRNEIAPSAKTYAAAASNFVHITYIDLMNTLMDFTGYIEGIIAQYRSEEVSHYYIPQTVLLEDDRPVAADKAVRDWIFGDDPQPIVLLAGYGMGKTTLAKRTTHMLAVHHRSTPTSRIPIYIRLEQLGSEISLEGLLSRHLASDTVVPGYSFQMFMELNRRGRFVIFLDGFDEMKHTLTWDTMRFNFQQLNRLVTGAARIALSGRPNAFLNEDEHREALHGERFLDRVEARRRIPDWPDYREYKIQAFSNDQIKEFIKSYVTHLQSASPQPRRTLADLLVRLDSPKGSRLNNLASRPVQLKMLVQILPTLRRDPSSLTEAELYSEFIDLIIRREMEKPSRDRYTLEERRDFACDLAWWMWREHHEVAVRSSLIPSQLVAPYCSETEDVAQVSRDLLSACFVEAKQPEGYYFPHRSFQEFLVARKIVSFIQAGELPCEGDMDVNPEILGFVDGLMQKREVKRFKELVWAHRGTLDDWILDILCSLVSGPEEIIADHAAMASPWGYVLVAHGMLRMEWTAAEATLGDFVRTRLRSFPVGVKEKPEWAKIFITLHVLLRDHYELGEQESQERILGFLNTARTGKGLVGNRKASPARVLEANRTPEFCYLASWRDGKWEYSPRWVNLRPAGAGRAQARQESLKESKRIPKHL